MIQKINLLEKVNSGALFQYLEIGRLNGHLSSVTQVRKQNAGFSQS
jgi:hypothetical protein